MAKKYLVYILGPDVDSLYSDTCISDTDGEPLADKANKVLPFIFD